MHVRPRFAAAFVAAALLSVIATAPALAVSQTSGLTIRITRPSAAVVNLGADPLAANAVSGSLLPADQRGSAGLCATSTMLDVVPDIGCVMWSGNATLAFTLPLETFSGYDVVATAS
jgi:hypothetical protein